MERFDALRDLVTFSRPIDILSSNLSQFDWDYTAPPFIVTASQIRNVLECFLADEYSAEEMESWANLIECREDLEFEEKNRKAMENVIYCLANPALQGEITFASCRRLLNDLA